MRQLKLLGITLAALLTIASAIATTSALANPTVLPEGARFTSKSGTGRLVTSANVRHSIECNADTNVGQFTTMDSGTVSIDFTTCKQNGQTCNSLGDATAGTILTGGTFQLVNITSTPLTVGILVEPKELHIECGAGAVLTLIRGSVIGELTGITSGVGTKTAKLTFTQTNGKQNIKTCIELASVCSGKTFELLTEVGSTFEESGEETVDELGSLSGNLTFTF